MKTTNFVKAWLNRASDDIVAAQILLETNGPIYPICFHCQQAVEKYLKGFLVYHQKPVRKIHDLADLLSLCSEIDSSFLLLTEQAKILDIYYLAARYPDLENEFDLEKAQEAFNAAEKIKEFVINKIKEN